MVRIGVMNLMMHGITKPNIIHVDSLSHDYEEAEINRLNINKPFSTNDKSIQGLYKYILANPPFTGKVDSKRISDNLDRVYPPQLDANGNRKTITVQSELLFLERIIYMLQEGGRACVIVPEGVLFNSGKTHQATRKLLLTDCTLEGIISLPSGVFLPYTGVKTSIIIFQKRKFRSTEAALQSVDVWYYGMDSDGYTLDNARRRKIDTPLFDTVEQWKNKDSLDQQDRKLEHFNIPVKEIIENDYELNFNLYKEFIYEPQDFEPIGSLIQKLQELENEISNDLSQLKDI